jgi:hypothetical protein
MVKKQSSTPKPLESIEKVPSEPAHPHSNKLRTSEVVIVITVIFAVAICVLLVLGAIAVVRNLPVWWNQLFGIKIQTWLI